MLNQFLLQKREAGCDEAGRGCLAGPVFAAAVILNLDFDNEWVNDSKQVSEKRRKELRPVIENSAMAWSVAMVDPVKIDEINILNASILAMHLALDGLSIPPQHIVVDGNRFKNYKDIPHTCIVKGDTKFKNIAAASILAKTYRDEFMEKIHEEFPFYNWRKNKGYPTVEHRKGIEMYGTSSHHRMTFRLLPAQYEFDFKS
ncbi:MAG TPA: ribonuclease HII [Moheibacter sp.]|nr:ribonuclease HII [Moheibacter sp.]